jgi:hypothetical protein
MLSASSESSIPQWFFTAFTQYEDPVLGLLNESHPLALAAHLENYDMPNWSQETR